VNAVWKNNHGRREIRREHTALVSTDCLLLNVAVRIGFKGLNLITACGTWWRVVGEL